MEKKVIPIAPNMDWEKAEKHLKDREEADYMCYLFLENNINALHALADDKIAAEVFFDKDERDEFLEQLTDVIETRRETNNNYMRAVAGR